MYVRGCAQCVDEGVVVYVRGGVWTGRGARVRSCAVTMVAWVVVRVV